MVGAPARRDDRPRRRGRVGRSTADGVRGRPRGGALRRRRLVDRRFPGPRDLGRRVGQPDSAPHGLDRPACRRCDPAAAHFGLAPRS